MTSAHTSAWDTPAFISQKLNELRTRRSLQVPAHKMTSLSSVKDPDWYFKHTQWNIYFLTSPDLFWEYVCVCTYKVAVIQNFQSQPKELLFSNVRKFSHTMFVSLKLVFQQFSTTEDCSKWTLRLYLSSRFSSRDTFYDWHEGKRREAYPKHSNHYWRQKLWTGNISFPTCQVGHTG